MKKKPTKRKPPTPAEVAEAVMAHIRNQEAQINTLVTHVAILEREVYGSAFIIHKKSFALP